MKKTIKLQNLDCGNCAAKIENAIVKLEGVIGVKVNFMGQKMILEAPDDRFNEILEEAKKIAKKIEPDIEVMA
ncbi:heavy-metal-associated domain-containing protein [Geosporobacter ferrireducens]|uniref:Heavy metal transporter n=1 Tax=Geosporobacter ferrireducens TaxID=1424294 RepID=A0A1D8GEX1_9FIRM|nr:cation transporter [Geosporobacter ferrireducens]AOT69448.1 heavy metal transporter [Geosporobacter ferrireducens]MTI56564.1 heavy metal transporter [Geosporobacter ferrireducens]